MPYRDYPASSPLLFGYDPDRDLPQDHLARLVDRVVDEYVTPSPKPSRRGYAAYNPRLCLKVLVYGYATGLRSSRQLEKHCRESMPYLFLTRGEAPSYRTLCSARTGYDKELEACWIGLFGVAEELGIKRLGRIDIDSCKIRANVGADSILKRHEFGFFLEMLQQIIAQAESQDIQEEAEGYGGQTQTGKAVGGDQMREVIRNVRKALREHKQRGGPAPELEMGPRMLPRLNEAVSNLKEAMDGERKHLSLTDPDAQMMAEGRSKRIQECHALEAAVDNGLLVCAQPSQSASDSNRLTDLVEAALAQEPEGVAQVTADSGYHVGEELVGLEEAGIDTCVPDPSTARDMRSGLAIGTTRLGDPAVAMTYDPKGDCYRCASGRSLRFIGQKQHGGRQVKVYRAAVSCADCALRSVCMKSPTGKYRTLKVAVKHEEITRILDRFSEPAHQQRYHQRGPNVETVFGFLRTAMNFNRWLLRSKEKVATEAAIVRVAYQLRKLHTAQLKANAAAAA